MIVCQIGLEKVFISQLARLWLNSEVLDWLSMSMGWDYISELRPQAGLSFISILYMSMENHGGVISTGEHSLFTHQSTVCQSYKQSLPVEN
jgi:hypothetical protein